jgi:hypothetical protein
MGRGSLVVLVAAAALVAAAVAVAGGHEQIKYNAADQAAARAATLHRADLTPAAGWAGGATKPDISAAPSCPNYPVDLSKFVLTGAAASNWHRGTRQINEQTEVLQTTRMVSQEWRLQVTAPGAVACLRTVLTQSFAVTGLKLVSFKRISFSKLGTYTAAFRLLADAGAQGSTVHLVIEVVLVGKGRAEVELTVSDFAAAQSSVSADALHYARILAGRVKT